MKFKRFFYPLSSFILVSTAIYAKAPKEIAAQRIADDLVKENNGLIDVIFHVTPPNREENIVIAAHLRKAVGEKSDSDDLSVINTDKPIIEVQKDQVRIGVLVPLKDSNRTTIGAVGLMYNYRKGDVETSFLRRSEKIRDDLEKDIVTKDRLFE